MGMGGMMKRRCTAVLVILLLIVFGGGLCMPVSAESPPAQHVALSPAGSVQLSGSLFSLTATYTVESNNNMLMGLGVRFHFNSAKLGYTGCDLFFGSSNPQAGEIGVSGPSPPQPEDPTTDDGDDETDTFVEVFWSSTVAPSFPGTDLPLDLCRLNFQALEQTEPTVSTNVNVSFWMVDPGCTGTSENANIEILSGYLVTFTAGDGGHINGDTEQPVPENGDCTPVTAVPDEGYHFTGWSGGYGDQNPLEVTGVTENMEITASFAINNYNVNFVAGANGHLAGTTAQTVTHGESCTAVEAVPDSDDYLFKNWTGDYSGTQNPLTVTNVTKDMNITANFEHRPFTVSFSADDGGSVSGNTSQSVMPGGNCTAVTAVPDDEHHFMVWSGSYSGTLNPLTITNVTEDMNVTAEFIALYDLWVDVLPQGCGTTTPAAGGTYTYEDGDVVPLTAVASRGYRFLEWMGEVADPQAASTSVTMSKDKAVTARFIRDLTVPDVDENGAVELDDAILILKILTGIVDSGISGDMSGDGTIGLEEECYTLQVLAGLRELPPPPSFDEGSASLIARAWDNNDGFDFSAGSVVPVLQVYDADEDNYVCQWNNADFVVEWNIIWLPPGVGIRDLGDGTSLDTTTQVPETEYLYDGPEFDIDLLMGHVYAFKLADGTYGALEFTEIATEVGDGTMRSSFSYKYQPDGTPDF